MSNKQIIEMAREAGFRIGQINTSTGDQLPFIAPVSATDCMVEVENLIKLAADHALEEAAKRFDAQPHMEHFGREIADDIRALKGTPMSNDTQIAATRNWADAVQSFADDLELPFLEAKSFLDEVFPQWMADKEAAGFVTLRRDELIEGDSYGVDGSDFYRCRICHAESGAGMLNNGIKHEHDCPLAARPLPASPTAPSTEQRPQNCGTGFCSCIECPFDARAQKGTP